MQLARCDAVITGANERAGVSANEGLFIIGEYKSSHNPICCPLWARGGGGGQGGLWHFELDRCTLLLACHASIMAGLCLNVSPKEDEPFFSKTRV